MKQFRIFWISALVLAANTVLPAQPASVNPMTDTIRWEYSTVLNLTNNETINLPGHMISYGNQSFVWNQDGVSSPYTFTVSSTDGSWQDVSTTGELTASTTWEGLAGTIRFFRDDAPRIRIDFGEPGGLTPHIVLQIQTITKL